jgi:NitT/TauT family transport system ATP-binding protein
MQGVANMILGRGDKPALPDQGLAGSRSLISVENVSKTFQTASGARIEALEDVNFTVADGEFISIVGASGCGKSTLLRMIAGLGKASRGRLLISGRTILGPSADVGVVFQNATLLPWLTLRENVGLPLRVGNFRAGAAGKVQELLSMVDLSSFANAYPYELSGGMQQRAAICRALVRDPKVLILDEPFGALDALTREHMNLEMQKIWLSSRKTVLMVTHSISEAIFLGDRVIVMSPRPGRIIFDQRIDVPRPRNFQDTVGHPEYLRLTREVRSLLMKGSSI